MSFQASDLRDLENLLEDAEAVVAMGDVHRGAIGADVIGMRHDVDDNRDSIQTAARMAAWEAERGYRSTYFMLHTARYWPHMREALEEIAGHGHEIGIHTDALAEALVTGDDPHLILHRALDTLRGYGHEVTGVAAHGNRLCHTVGFVNDEQFAECPRPEMGRPDRHLVFNGRVLKLDPRPLADFGLQYDTHRLPHGRYLSDTGRQWNEPFPGHGEGQLHVLQHPDWWREAFQPERAQV